MPLREIGLKQDYPVPETPQFYPGRNSAGAQILPNLEKVVSAHVGLPLAPVQDRAAYGKFRIALEGAKGAAGVHIDNADYTAILYLTLPADCQDGTHFFRHLPTGTDRAPRTDEELSAIGCGSPQEFWDKIMKPHTNDPTKWERISTAPMRFNRLVILEAKQWHDAGKSFGRDASNGRLIYLTGFNVVG